MFLFIWIHQSELPQHIQMVSPPCSYDMNIHSEDTLWEALSHGPHTVLHLAILKSWKLANRDIHMCFIYCAYWDQTVYNWSSNLAVENTPNSRKGPLIIYSPARLTNRIYDIQGPTTLREKQRLLFAGDATVTEAESNEAVCFGSQKSGVIEKEKPCLQGNNCSHQQHGCDKPKYSRI